jgi:hypothetical protein
MRGISRSCLSSGMTWATLISASLSVFFSVAIVVLRGTLL